MKIMKNKFGLEIEIIQKTKNKNEIMLEII